MITGGKNPFFEDTSGYDLSPDRYQTLAKAFVKKDYNNIEGNEPLLEKELYVVWFSKTLQNWKALVSTTRPGDGLYFEVTYNGDKEEVYVDTYLKISNAAHPLTK